jgi:hypothetical protein
LLVPLVMHATIWGSLGAVGGLAFGLGLGSERRLRLIFVALLGACLGAALYEVLGAMIDPLADTSDLISRTWRTRLIARLLVALGAAAAIGLSSFAARATPRTAGSQGSGSGLEPQSTPSQA